jgi:hypothetical protein
MIAGIANIMNNIEQYKEILERQIVAECHENNLLQVKLNSIYASKSLRYTRWILFLMLIILLLLFVNTILVITLVLSSGF